MSFSQQVKKELADVCQLSFSAASTQISAMLYFAKTMSGSGQILQTEQRVVADCLIDLLADVGSPIMTLISAPNPRKKNSYQYYLTVDNPTERCRIEEKFMPDDFFESVDFERDDIASAFVRGAFLVCGSVSDPQKEYHLEFVLYDHTLASGLANILSVRNIPLKYVIRKNQMVLYLKESESIEDLLTFMGATKMSLSLMEVKVMKDVRNRVNRITNCETANLGKVAVASVNQLEDIRCLEKYIGLEELPSSLEEAARFRRQYPELSLQELAQKMGTVTRSGLYHRFQRIHNMAENERKRISRR